MLDLSELGHGVFQMDLIFGKIIVYHPVNIRLRSRNTQELHLLDHVITSEFLRFMNIIQCLSRRKSITDTFYGRGQPVYFVFLVIKIRIYHNY